MMLRGSKCGLLMGDALAQGKAPLVRLGISTSAADSLIRYRHQLSHATASGNIRMRSTAPYAPLRWIARHHAEFIVGRRGQQLGVGRRA